MAFLPACEKGKGDGLQPNASPGGSWERERKASLGRATPDLSDLAQSHTPAPRARGDLLLGVSVSCHSASCFLYLKGRSAFSKPVGSMSHKQQCTAGLLYGLSPCDKCASSVVQRFSDTLPWAIILLAPSPSHTLSVRLSGSLFNIVTITHPGQ